MGIIKNYSNEVVNEDDFPKIFLAGPTNRNGITQWRVDACNILDRLGFGGIVYIPEYLNETFDPKRYVEQCLWERETLEIADCILFWIPRNIRLEMPAYTTNIEFGTYLQRKPEQIVYGYPVGAEKMKYLDWLYKYEKGPEAVIHNDLEEALNSSIAVAEWIFRK